MAAHPTLSPQLVRTLSSRPDLTIPSAAQLDLPERAVQFGTGALLRGLVDAILDDANRRGDFGGRVVMVGSTGSGRDRAINEQGGLFTLVTQGLVDGAARRECRIVASVSRALAVSTQWDEVLRCAERSDLELVFSNTTEIGIVLDEKDAAGAPGALAPRSFPGKLTAFLLHRARSCALDASKAPIVIPTELIEDNGTRLGEIVRTLAARWGASAAELAWLSRVRFCNTLVDRIVPGTPGEPLAAELRALLPYEDGMVTVCEPYRLLAIEGDEALRSRLGFAAADPGVIVAESIAPYRLRKVRLLNGAHTSFVSLALLAGCRTVREAVEHPALGGFLRRVLLDEIVPSVDVPGAQEFAHDVLARFANPFLEHQLWDITLQGTTKMRVRVVPSILDFARASGEAPQALALGFAGYLAFQRGEMHERRRAAGDTVPTDEAVAPIRTRGRALGDGTNAIPALVDAVCGDAELWGTDLRAVPGFAEAVAGHLAVILDRGAVAAIDMLRLARTG
jgi:tagaturonate reductase